MITFRTTGPWGPGKGSNLAPAEVDENFHTLDERLGEVENNPPIGVGIVDFDVDEDDGTFTVLLSNGSAQGPFPLPAVTLQWRDEWTPGTQYEVNNLFLVPNDAVYLVVVAHESPTEFDPEVGSITDETLFLRKIFDVSNRVPVVEAAYTDDTILLQAAEHSGKYVRVLDSNTVFVGVEPDGWEVGDMVTLRQAGDGHIEIIPIGGADVLTPETLRSRRSGSTITLTYVGGGEFDLAGDLELLEELVTETETST